jgi:hypothetical protein
VQTLKNGTKMQREKEITQLAKLLTAHENCRWRRGVNAIGLIYPIRILDVDENGNPCTYVFDGYIFRDCEDTWESDGGDKAYFDLSDAPTHGVLFDMLCETLGNPEISMEYDDGDAPGPFWRVWDRGIMISSVLCTKYKYTTDRTARGSALALALLSIWAEQEVAAKKGL